MEKRSETSDCIVYTRDYYIIIEQYKAHGLLIYTFKVFFVLAPF